MLEKSSPSSTLPFPPGLSPAAPSTLTPSTASLPSPPTLDPLHSFQSYPASFPSEVSSLRFDAQQELLWVGHGSGNVRSYIMPHMEAYTSRQVDYQPILDMATDLRFHQGMLVLTSDSLKLIHRRGLNAFSIAPTAAQKSFQCMGFTSDRPTHELLVSTPEALALVHLQRGEVMRTIETAGVQCLRSLDARTVVQAHAQGTLRLRDTRTWRECGHMAVHSGGFTDLLLVAPHTVYAAGAHAVTVADVRMLARTAYLPLVGTRRIDALAPFVLALTPTHLHVVHASTCTTLRTYDTWAACTMHVSATNDLVALGDAHGHVHILRTAAHAVQVNPVSDPLELPSLPPPTPPPHLPFHPIVPLHLFCIPPTPAAQPPLSCAWPAAVPHSTHLVPAPIPKAFLAQAKWTCGGAVGSVVKPTHTPAQHWPYQTPLAVFKSHARSSPGSAQGSTRKPRRARTALPADDYQKMSIQYSKFGVHDFDFHLFNTSPYAGLETDVEHTYLNNYLQTLFFSAPLNTLAMDHAYTICEEDLCLLCETGFLFRTLQQARICRTTHWSYVFSQRPETEALDLREHPNVPFPCLPRTLHQCARFLMDVFHKESQGNCAAYVTHMDVLETCTQCRHVQEKPSHVFLLELIYPGRRSSHASVSFVDLLSGSVASTSTNRGWCDRCKRYVMLSKRKSVVSFPDVLQIACHVQADWNTDWWITSQDGPKGTPFLPEKIRLHLDGNEAKCELPDNGTTDGVYVLTAVVCEVLDAEPHIISHIRVRDDEWYLFNDFRVRQVPDTHVFQFPKWKIPCILQYTKLSHWRKGALLSPVWSKVTFLEENDVVNPDRCSNLPLPLRASEIGPDFICAIDAEFVSLREEEAEFASDGSKTMRKPAHLTLARVSVVRASGVHAGTVALDEYVVPKATVVDYLTPYSGIVAADLRPATSCRRLVTLKTVYRKLRYMVDQGVKFIGHDLAQDFRILHLAVPAHQLLDTVHLYSLPDHPRKLSLKFLAWAVLGRSIQAATHDSVEDASVALALYEKHTAMDPDEWKLFLNDIHKLGAAHGYRPPLPLPQSTNGTGQKS